jgi:hypothetical protein
MSLYSGFWNTYTSVCAGGFEGEKGEGWRAYILVLQQAGWGANIDYAASVASCPGMGTGLGVGWGWEGPWVSGVGCWG